MSIRGDKAVQRAFRELAPRLAKKVIRKALRAGAKVIQTDAKSNAPVKTGLTKRAIKVRAAKRTRKAVLTLLVTIGKSNYQGLTFYGAFQEFGWKTGKRGSADRHQVEGKHFLERALESKQAEAEQRAIDLIESGVDQVVTEMSNRV